MKRVIDMAKENYKRGFMTYGEYLEIAYTARHIAKGEAVTTTRETVKDFFVGCVTVTPTYNGWILN